MMELPRPVLKRMLSFLCGKEVIRARHLCRSFDEVSREESLWKEICKNELLWLRHDKPLRELWRDMYLRIKGNHSNMMVAGGSNGLNEPSPTEVFLIYREQPETKDMKARGWVCGSALDRYVEGMALALDRDERAYWIGGYSPNRQNDNGEEECVLDCVQRVTFSGERVFDVCQISPLTVPRCYLAAIGKPSTRCHIL